MEYYWWKNGNKEGILRGERYSEDCISGVAIDWDIISTNDVFTFTTNTLMEEYTVPKNCITRRVKEKEWWKLIARWDMQENRI